MLQNSRYFVNKFYLYLGLLYYLYVREQMETGIMEAKLKKIFSHHIENIDFNQLSQSAWNQVSCSGRNNRSKAEQYLKKNLAILPQLPLNQIHLLCRNQEKNVMEKVMEIKQMDLYEEMAHICPNHDLKIMKSYSQEEVNEKIHQYETKIVIMAEAEREHNYRLSHHHDIDQSDDNLMNAEIEAEVENLSDPISDNEDSQKDGLHSMNNIGHINECIDGYLDINMMHNHLQDNGGMRNLLEEEHDRNILWVAFDHMYDLH